MNKGHVEILACNIEANPDFYNQARDPVVISDDSCGCIAHFASWLNGTRHAEGTFGLTSYLDVDIQTAGNIYGWRCFEPDLPTASEAAEMLRQLAKTGR